MVQPTGLLIMLVKLLRIGNSKFNVAALTANIGFDLPVQAILENQGLRAAIDDDLQFPVRPLALNQM